MSHNLRVRASGELASRDACLVRVKVSPFAHVGATGEQCRQHHQANGLAAFSKRFLSFYPDVHLRDAIMTPRDLQHCSSIAGR